MDGLVLSQLCKQFDGVVAVDKTTLSAGSGSFLSLLGPSGCGKTTTLRMIAGLIEPSSGTIQLDGRLLSTGSKLLVPPEHRNMSMIFQSYAIWPHKTVLENVAYGVRLRKLSKAETRQRVMRALDVVHMAGFAERYPSQLSGGQQQRVGLARAIAVEPRVLLMDEPLSNLDATMREEMRFEIRRIHDEFKITTVYVTHDISEAIVASDQIAVMNNGRVEQLGSPEEVYEHPQTSFVAAFIGPVNLLPGRSGPGGTVEVAGGSHSLSVSEPPTHTGDDLVTVAFRPHAASLKPRESPRQRDQNLLPGTVLRHVYLGDTRDYLVELAGGTVLRVVTPPDVMYRPGDLVDVVVPVASCKVVVDDHSGAESPDGRLDDDQETG